MKVQNKIANWGRVGSNLHNKRYPQSRVTVRTFAGRMPSSSRVTVTCQSWRTQNCKISKLKLYIEIIYLKIMNEICFINFFESYDFVAFEVRFSLWNPLFWIWTKGTLQHLTRWFESISESTNFPVYNLVFIATSAAFFALMALKLKNIQIYQ